MQYRAELDGLRAVCILFTICNHVTGTPTFLNGTIGVDLFFALSGWLITTLIFDENDRSGRFSLGAFYIRRVFRILPLYFVTLLLYALAAQVAARAGLAGKAAEFARSFWYMAAMCSEYRPPLDTVFAHGWTLGIEEKFYLAWPALLALTGFRAWRALLACAGIYALLTWLMFDLNGMYGAAGGIRGYAGLSFGSALAILARRPAVQAALARSGGVAVLAFAGFYAASVLAPHWGWNVAVALTGAIMVGSMWHNRQQPLARVLGFGALAAAGKLTYAIYLLHVLSKQVALVVLTKLQVPESFVASYLATYAVSIAVGIGAYFLVEQPMIRLGRRFANRSLPPVFTPIVEQQPV